MLRMLINGHICLSLIDTSRRRRRLAPVTHTGATATAWADNCLPCVFVWGWQIHNHPLKILHLGAARRLWGDWVIVCGWLVSIFLLLISFCFFSSYLWRIWKIWIVFIRTVTPCVYVCADRFTASLSPKSVGMQHQVADLKIKMMESANREHEGHNKKALHLYISK